MSYASQLPGMQDHPDNRGVYVELWVIRLVDGDLTVALLLSQLLWWHQPAKDGSSRLSFQRDGERWLVRKDTAWERETCLSVKQVRRAKSVLTGMGLVECRPFRIAGAPTSAWRPLGGAIRARLAGEPGPDLPRQGQNGFVPAGVVPTDPPGTNGTDPPGTNPSSKTTEVRPQLLPLAPGGARTPAPRPRDLPFEAMCEVCGIDWHELTATERQRVNAALKQVRDVWRGGDQDLAYEIARRARNYLEGFEAALTPMALAGRWASLASRPPVGRRLTGADRGLPAAERWLARQEAR